MRIEQIEIKNYRSFRHAVSDDLPPMVVVVGANGTGKSTLLDVFSFLKDALTQNSPWRRRDAVGSANWSVEDERTRVVLTRPVVYIHMRSALG